MSDKVKAATVAAAVSTIGMWLLKQYAGVDVPDVVNIAVVTLLTVALGYVWPEQNPAPSAVAAVRAKHLA